MTEKDQQTIRPATAPAAALAIAMLAAFMFVPVAGSFIIMLLPAPLSYLWLSGGAKAYLKVAAACVLLVTVAGGFPSYTALVLGLCVTGQAIGNSISNRDHYSHAIIKGTFIPVAIVWPLLAAYFLAVRVNPWSRLDAVFDKGIAESLSIYKELGMSQADLDAMLPSLQAFSRFVIDCLPAVYISMMAAVSLACYLLAAGRADKTGLIKRHGEPLNMWCAPDYLVWGVIVPGFLFFVPVSAVSVAAANLLLVFSTAFLFQGIAVTDYFFDRVKLTSALRILAYVLILMQPFLLLAMLGAGLFDTWADFRKLRGKPRV